MKKNAKYWVSGMILLLLAGATVWIETRPPGENYEIQELGKSQNHSTNSGEAVKKNPSSETNSSFQILSDTLTPTGRVYIVNKDGITKTAIIPEHVQFTREQLEEFAFYVPPPPRKPRQQSRNEELIFYGIALDETGSGVAVSVTANALIGRPNEGLVREKTDTISAANGKFDLRIPWGQQVTVTVDGGTNYINPPPQSFQFGPVGGQPIHKPDMNNPVVFRLQTRKPEENLFTFEKRYRASNDGTPVYLDLTTGNISESNGDLKISIQIPEPYTNLRQFPWSLSLDMPTGGIIETGDSQARMEYLHEAPEQGYNSGINVEYTANSSNYDRQFEAWYYVKSRGGQIYAKIYFDMTTRWDSRGVPFGIRAVVNTNGSRYLHTEP